jgi:hypothetical protein
MSNNKTKRTNEGIRINTDTVHDEQRLNIQQSSSY